MFPADDDEMSVGSTPSAPSAPSSAAQNAAMALAILGPNHRGNVTFEAIDEEQQEQEGSVAEEEANPLNSTATSAVDFAETEIGKPGALK